MRIATAHSYRQTCAYLAPLSRPSPRAIIEAMRTAEARKPSIPAPAAPWLRRALFVGAALVVLALDQTTKALVRTFMDRGDAWPDGWPVRLHHVTNTGAAFGILKDQTGFLIVTTVIGVAAIYLYYRHPPFDHLVGSVAIGMMLGGAIGNLVDRVRLGEVTDFIDLPSWPSFNVADSSITIGIVVLLFGYALLAERAPPNAEREEAGTDRG